MRACFVVGALSLATTSRRTSAGTSTARSTFRPGPGALAGPLLFACAAGSLLLYIALFLLLRGRSFRLTQTATLVRWPQLRAVSDALTPDSLITATWRTDQAATHEFLYLLLALALVGLWLAALWLVRPGGRTVSLRWILLPIVLFGVPLIVLPGMFSGDLYLYMFYGRMIARYGANPILVAPDQFAGDPHLAWVYWKWLPSAYGPVWLLLSGALSAVAGDALWENIFTYKSAMLVIHLLATIAVWKVLRDTRPELAAWGAIFYGWNPMVLHETVGSAHNDVLVGLFGVLALLVLVHKRWLFGIFFVVAAAMVKLMALILLPFLILAWLRAMPTARDRRRAAVLSIVGSVLSGVALYLPLWGGTAMFDNIRENPAAREYQNSFWDLLVLKVLSPGQNPMVAVLNSDLDFVRNVAFVCGYLFLLWRFWRGGDLGHAWVGVWFAYFLFAGWMWPWYFVAVVPIAAFCGPGRAARVATGLTMGGLLFWLGWPDPALPAAPWFHNYRAVLMFAPAMVLAVWPVGRLFSRQTIRPQLPVKA